MIMKKEEHSLTNLTKLFVLLSLSKRPSHGYEIIDKFERKTGKRLSCGQLYPLLNSLKRKRLVNVKIEYYGDRKRKVYSLTKGGKKLANQLSNQLKSILEI